MKAAAAAVLAVWAAGAARAGNSMGVGFSYSVDLPARGRMVRLHAEEAGAGTPVVLIHGLGCSTFTWRKIAPDLARDHRVVALDLEGFGQSEKPLDAPYSAASQTELLVAFLRKRGISEATLIGHSFGGTVALFAALELRRAEPDRIRRLIVIDAPALPQEFPRLAGFVEAPVLPYGALTVTLPEVLARTVLTLARRPGNPPPEEDIRGYAAPMYDPGARHAFIATARHIIGENAQGYEARLRTLDLPVLLVWCWADEIVPYATGRRLVRVLPRATLRTLRGCNHLPQDERPGALAAVLRPFLAAGGP